MILDGMILGFTMNSFKRQTSINSSQIQSNWTIIMWIRYVHQRDLFYWVVDIKFTLVYNTVLYSKASELGFPYQIFFYQKPFVIVATEIILLVNGTLVFIEMRCFQKIEALSHISDISEVVKGTIIEYNVLKNGMDKRDWIAEWTLEMVDVTEMCPIALFTGKSTPEKYFFY